MPALVQRQILARRRANATLLPHRIVAQEFRSKEPPVPLTRRELLLASAAFGLVGAVSTFVLPRPALAEDTTDTTTTASPADLADAGPNGDLWLGSDKAPVTIIEYASMT
ncbi:MAG: hypothetical protein WBD71_16650, partial [Xanthobacteraceae bacterium]